MKMDLLFLKRHRYSLLRLGVTLASLFVGVAVFGVLSIIVYQQRVITERDMRAGVREMETEGSGLKTNFEAREKELRAIKLFAERVDKYLGIAKEMNKAVGANSRTMIERLAADNSMTVNAYTPIYNQRKLISGQKYVGTELAVQVKGSYSGFGRFFAILENTIPYLHLNQLVAEPADNDPMNRGQLKFTLRCFIIDGTEKTQ